MKYALNCLLASLLVSLSPLRADDAAALTAVTAADDARVKATLAADAAGLNAAFSNELHYGHSYGVADTKKSLVDAITSGKTKYKALTYTERKFTFPAPDVALMTGRVNLEAVSAKGETKTEMAFLAVWKKEVGGAWRFLAWQSCRIPAPEAK